MQDVGHAMSSFMLEYWDKEHWNVTLSTDPRVLAGLEHGSREGSGKNAAGKRVRRLYRMSLLESYSLLKCARGSSRSS